MRRTARVKGFKHRENLLPGHLASFLGFRFFERREEVARLKGCAVLLFPHDIRGNGTDLRGSKVLSLLLKFVSLDESVEAWKRERKKLFR